MQPVLTFGWLVLGLIGAGQLVANQLVADEPVAGNLATDPLVDKYRQAAVTKWADEMKRIARLDETQKDPDNAILFLGSSSIRLWQDIQTDLQPWPVISRGYGGARFSDLAVLAPQIVQPHKFRAAVIFVGNDVTGDKEDKSPEEVTQLFEHVVKTIRTHQPSATVFVIEITPTPKRWAAWEKIKQVNAALRQSCQSGQDLHFIATADQYLNNEGGPMPELFKDDKLHQNRDGYARWSQRIRAELESVLKHP